MFNKSMSKPFMGKGRGEIVLQKLHCGDFFAVKSCGFGMLLRLLKQAELVTVGAKPQN